MATIRFDKNDHRLKKKITEQNLLGLIKKMKAQFSENLERKTTTN